jgi:hypothetical protein
MEVSPMTPTDREAIARIQSYIEWHDCPHSSDEVGPPIDEDDLRLILSLLTRPEATTGAGERLREALEKLRPLSEKAQPDKWKACPSVEWDFFSIYPDTGKNEFPIACEPRLEGKPYMKAEFIQANFAFIVAAVNFVRAALAQPLQDEGGVIQADTDLVNSWVTEVAIPLPEVDALRLAERIAAHRRAFSRERGDA